MTHYSTYQSQFIEMFGTLGNPKGKIESLGTLCNIQRGGSPRPISEYITDQSDGLNWIKIGDTDDSMYITKTEEKIKPSGLRKTRQVYAGDLLLSNSMSFGRPYILKIDGCIHDGWLVLHINDATKLSPIYLCSYLSQQGTYSEMAKLAAGGVVQNLNSNIIKQLAVIVPNMEEQTKYIQILEQADKSKFTSLKSQFIEMFKDLPINGKIEDLVERNIASVKKSYQSGDEIEYIDISSIDNTSNTVVETTKYEVASAPSRAQQCVKNGDILVSTVRPINRNIAVVTSNLPDLVASTGFCILRPKDGYREYLLSVVKSDAYTERMCDKASGGLYPAVNNSDVLSYGIHIPNKELAQKVSSIYQQADKSKYIN